MRNIYYTPRRNYRLNPETPEELAIRLEKQREAVRGRISKDLKAWAESQEKVDLSGPIRSSLYASRYAA